MSVSFGWVSSSYAQLLPFFLTDLLKVQSGWMGSIFVAICHVYHFCCHRNTCNTGPSVHNLMSCSFYIVGICSREVVLGVFGLVHGLKCLGSSFFFCEVQDWALAGLLRDEPPQCCLGCLFYLDYLYAQSKMGKSIRTIA